MITPEFARTMARYNVWQNGSLYGAADGLSDKERRKDRGAFFGSIHGTLNHLLWGDQMWLHRFIGTPKPAANSIQDTVEYIKEWDALKMEREATDRAISAWVEGLSDKDVVGDLTWFAGSVGKELTKPKALLIMHMFSHQTHHRGQVHAMLTAAGAKPDDTDLPLMPANA